VCSYGGEAASCCCQFYAFDPSRHVMTNFVLRLLKRKVVDKTKARPRPAHRDDASSDDDDADDEGFHESKFDYDEGVSTSVDSIDQLSFAHHDNGLVGLRRTVLSIPYGTLYAIRQ